MKKIQNINQITSNIHTLQIDLYHLYFNDNTERVFDSLEGALHNCYNFLASKSYALPVTIIYEKVTREPFTHEYISQSVAVYDLTQNDIQVMLSLCNNALARYYDIYSDDWDGWYDKCKQCRARATAVIMQKLNKQVKV